MAVKIRTKDMKKFMEKSIMTEEQVITEAMLQFTESGLKIAANSGSQQARVSSLLKSSTFEEYSPIGNLAIGSLNEFPKVIDRFGEKISLSVEGNLLTIKGDGKSVGIELMSEELISTDIKEPDLTFEETFILPAGCLNDIIKDVNLSKDVVIVFKTEKGKLIVTNTGKYKFTRVIECPTIKGDVSVRMGAPFIQATNKLDGELEISMKKDYPMKILEKTQESVISLIVAPRVETE